MADTKSELNDIILNKGTNSFSGFKKVLLAVASFAVLLIIVIVIMSSLNKDDKKDLSKTILPPEPTVVEDEKSKLFQSVDILEEKGDDEQKRLEAIANEIKNKTLNKEQDQQIPVVDETKSDTKVANDVTTIADPYENVKKEPVKEPKVEPKKEVVKTEPKKEVKKEPKLKQGTWYVQVGSFAHTNPNKRLIKKIKTLGYSHKQYKIVIKGKEMTKLLIGPYSTYKEAQKAKPQIKKTINPEAFVYQVAQ